MSAPIAPEHGSDDLLEMPTVSLPTVMFRPTGQSTRPLVTKWIGRPQVHSDDDGASYLVIECQHMEISIGFGEGSEGIPEMQMIVEQLQQRIVEIKEFES